MTQEKESGYVKNSFSLYLLETNLTYMNILIPFNWLMYKCKNRSDIV